MSLQPLHLPSEPQVQAVGDVQIDSTAAIAPGVILHAAPGCRIVISGGVCIGMGSIIKAYDGNIQLDEGVSLGPGVLIMGISHVGANVCIGGIATIWHIDVSALTVIPAGSVLGDPTRQVKPIEQNEPVEAAQQTAPATPPPPLQPVVQPQDLPTTPPTTSPAAEISDPWDNSESQMLPEEAEDVEDLSITESTEPHPDLDAPTKAPGQATYGKVMLNQLLVTLFPYK